MHENNLNNKNLRYYYQLFLLAMQANFSLQDNAIFYRQQSLKELPGSHVLNYVLTYMHVLFFHYYEAHTEY